MRYRYYIKKLTANELGYRNGHLTTGQMFYISKQAVDFFPHLSSKVMNDTVVLEFSVDYKNDPVYLNLVYHNDKYIRSFGTRDEYRIYLNREIAPDDFFYRPGDLIVIERLDDNKYNLKRFRDGDHLYNKLDLIFAANKLRGYHALTHSLQIT